MWFRTRHIIDCGIISSEARPDVSLLSCEVEGLSSRLRLGSKSVVRHRQDSGKSKSRVLVWDGMNKRSLLESESRDNPTSCQGARAVNPRYTSEKMTGYVMHYPSVAFNLGTWVQVQVWTRSGLPMKSAAPSIYIFYSITLQSNGGRRNMSFMTSVVER